MIAGFILFGKAVLLLSSAFLFVIAVEIVFDEDGGTRHGEERREALWLAALFNLVGVIIFALVLR